LWYSKIEDSINLSALYAGIIKDKLFIKKGVLEGI
jgi:hypothetical protein